MMTIKEKNKIVVIISTVEMWKRAFGAIIATLRGEEDMLITCLEIVDKYMSYPHGSDGLEIIHI